MYSNNRTRIDSLIGMLQGTPALRTRYWVYGELYKIGQPYNDPLTGKEKCTPTDSLVGLLNVIKDASINPQNRSNSRNLHAQSMPHDLKKDMYWIYCELYRIGQPYDDPLTGKKKCTPTDSRTGIVRFAPEEEVESNNPASQPTLDGSSLNWFSQYSQEPAAQAVMHLAPPPAPHLLTERQRALLNQLNNPTSQAKLDGSSLNRFSQYSQEPAAQVVSYPAAPPDSFAASPTPMLTNAPQDSTLPQPPIRSFGGNPPANQPQSASMNSFSATPAQFAGPLLRLSAGERASGVRTAAALPPRYGPPGGPPPPSRYGRPGGPPQR
jgi:hypothetical protein